MTVHFLGREASPEIDLSQEDVQWSAETTDGSRLVAEVAYPGQRVHEIWVSGTVIAPSGRRYRITELRWRADQEGWLVELQGEEMLA